MKHEDPGNCLDAIATLFAYTLVTIGIGLAIIAAVLMTIWRD